MSIQDLGSIGELVGAILVLVTLVYLAIQLQATNRIAKVDGHRDLIKQFNEWYGGLGDPDLMEILLRGSEDFTALSAEEKLRFDAYLHRFFHICEQAWYMGRGRYVPEGSYDGFMNAAIALSSHGATVWWETARPAFAEDFVNMINELRANSPEVPPLREFLPTYIYIHENRIDA